MRHYRPADDPERRSWQDPERILDDIGLMPGMTFVDVGCGGGFFALPAARVVGETGRVYRLDLSAMSIGGLREAAERETLTNVKGIVGRAEDLIPCDACADNVFFANVMHDFSDPVRVLENSRKALRPQGWLVNLEWKRRSMLLGPPLERRLSEERSVELIDAAGFHVAEAKDCGPYHYIIKAALRQQG
jgi:ubiquinone/menaquinone biosynthesis C-methylase UbiE